jgi:hypothetical protein
MKLYYHKTDGGAEYYCAHPLPGTSEGDIRTAILRTDGEELELDTYKLAQMGISVIIKS